MRVKVIERLVGLRAEIHNKFTSSDEEELTLVDSLDNITSKLTDWQRLRHDASVTMSIYISVSLFSFTVYFAESNRRPM